jgi:predicted phage baseplate assembly protein
MYNLPMPNLDDRRWTDLVQEGQALIPFYAPEWTDHNASDPGVTLVELFAWLAEMDIYQLNRIPERHRLKFLSLIGIRPHPPKAARTVLSFRLAPAAMQPPYPRLPASVELEASDAFGQPVRFRTLEALTVVASGLQAIQVKTARGYQDLTARWLRGEPVLPLGDDPQPGTALYLGFDAPLPENTPVSLYLAFTCPWAEDAERQRLIQEAQMHQLVCRPPDTLVTCEPEEVEPSEEAGTAPTPPHHSAVTAWEFLDAQLRWQPLDPSKGQVDDATRSFTLSGRVVITLPGAMGKNRLGQAGAELYTLRCRFVSGAYDAAPEMRCLAVNAILGEQAVTPARLKQILPSQPEFQAEILCQDAVECNSQDMQKLSELVDMDWLPRQSVEIAEKPVLIPGFQLYTLEDGVLLSWEQVYDFDASGPADRHYVLDATNGKVTFGDGQNGRVPPAKVLILADYLTTRAEAGNLPARSSLKLMDNAQNRSLLPDPVWLQQQLAAITNPLPALGGAAEEELAHAEGRAFELVNQVERAVTLQDIETLARKTPGARLARAWAQANRHPALPCFLAPGVVSLVILPHLPKERPAPSPALRRRVMAFVSRRRVIGTRLEVIGPEYVTISVRARVQAQRGVDPADLQRRIVAALNSFFHPLSGGPEGQGWPFGRDIYRSEVMQIIDETSGVDHVLSLEILARGCEPQCANICLGPVGLVAAGQHQIEIGGVYGK